MENKKMALITGSYGDLGTCFVNIHAGDGGNLILVGRNQKKLDEQADSIRKLYDVEVHTIAADLSSPDAAQLIYDTCKEKGWQAPMMKLAPLFPKKTMLNFVYDQQSVGSAKRK